MGLLKILLAGVLSIVMAGLIIVYSGVYSVAADEPHFSATRWLLQTARNRSIAVRLNGIAVPDDLQRAARIERGGELYGSTCQRCHLGPGVDPTALHRGLNPKPPRLETHAGHHGLAEQFWIAKHGIKMTGMPAWGETLTDTELWDIVAFLDQLPAMAPETFQNYTSVSRD